MTESSDLQPLSRVELVVLARLSAAKGATKAEIAKALRDVGMPLAKPELAECAAAALAALRVRGLAIGPPEPAEPVIEPTSQRGGSTGTRKTKKTTPAVPRFTPTEAGRLSLGDAFGLAVARTWEDMRESIVPAWALGEQPGSDAAAAALDSAESMIATLLRRDHSLGGVASIAGLCDQIIARALRMPQGPVTLAGIRAYALAMHCGVTSKAELEAIAVRFPTTDGNKRKKRPRGEKAAKDAKRGKPVTPEMALRLLAERLASARLGIDNAASGTTKLASKKTLVQSLQRRWVRQQDEADDAQRPSALRSVAVLPSHAAAEAAPAWKPMAAAPAADAAETLLIAVREAIPMVGSDGRYGKENVFISALWQQVARDARLSQLSLDRFKQWLVTANRNQQLALARADMVDDMDARLVEASEIEDLNATFHFVLDRRDSLAPWQVHYGQ